MTAGEGPSWDGRLVVTWSELTAAVEDMVRRLAERPPFDAVVAVARGGLVPATIIGHGLGIDDVHVVLAKRNAVSRPRSPRLARPVVQGRSFTGRQLAARRVLVVDDICGDGQTLETVRELVLGCGATDVETATVFMNERCTRPPTVLGRVTSSWVVFPWERDDAPSAPPGRDS